jgi:hypothetical protein
MKEIDPTMAGTNSENPEGYRVKLSRRESIKWLGVLSASAAMPVSALENLQHVIKEKDAQAGHFASWPEVKLTPITSKGYGQDPKLVTPETSPWPRTLSEDQLNLVAVLSDIIVPAEDDVPSASAVGVPEVIDEWVSAPYPMQQQHRGLLIPGLLWLENESAQRFGKPFVQTTINQQQQIIDNIAYLNEKTPAELKLPCMFFVGLRTLVVGAFRKQ